MTPDRPRPVAIITGGARGIGLGIARALARDGWDLALCGLRSEDAVREVLDDLRRDGADAIYSVVDVSRTADHPRFIDAVTERWGAVNALVNNAGRGPRVRADVLEASEASFDEVLRTNLQGPYFLTQRVARLLVDQRRKSPDSVAAIVFVTSVSATMASVNRGEYCVSKAGLAMAARLFAVRLAEHDIPVYDVRPGIITTDMTAPVREAYDQRIAEGLIPARRWGTPEDVGRVVASLLRGDLPYASGSVIHVDGGLAIPRL
ncbi:MAG: 3-ketoacyl-ACP reductase [Acidobacteria bacterium]|nr:3-ketoacyl-ACP reductase [Acidobacteriota bacterium]